MHAAEAREGAVGKRAMPACSRALEKRFCTAVCDTSVGMPHTYTDQLAALAA